MKTIDFSYFIERYNANEMSDAERIWFRKELEGNDQLREEVNLRKRTDEVLQNQNIISLRNKLSEIENRRKANIIATKRKKPVYLKYGAVFAVLVLIGNIYLFTGKNLSSDEIMTRYYKAYETTAPSRSAQPVTNDDFTLALEFFNTHDYKNAAIFFSKVVEREPENMYSTLLNGISNFENNKYPEAKRSLGIVIADKTNLYIDQAQWYLALCYVNTGENDKAIRQLEIVKERGGIYSNDAKKIIRKLK
jgi:tetratricopeptide (TPR) repeat protein